MKKRFSLVLLLLVCALMATACSSDKSTAALATTTSSVPRVINSSEYTLYQNIFYNDYATQYSGKSMNKRGVYALVHDAYNETDRYYVTGYLDQTLCCDWQWEFTVADPSTLPAPGSLIEVSGTFVQNDGALDSYWIENATVNTLTTYTGAKADLDMTVMTGTLERVQVLNYMNYPEVFEGQTVFAYGRVYDLESFQDPYYDGSWTAAFTTQDEIPAIGTSIVLRGVMNDGVVSNAKLEVINN